MEILKNIPFIFVAFLLFLFVLNMRYRKTNRQQQETEDAFWERERLANATRKQDISNLPYITIPKEIIPSNLPTDSVKALESLSQQQILNLTGKTNTDLKLEYGVANLEFLSACDERFIDLVNALLDCSKDLLDANRSNEAKQLLEYAVSIQADAKPLYLRLAKLYLEEGNPSAIDNLIASANELNSLSKDGIVADLKSLNA